MWQLASLLVLATFLAPGPDLGPELLAATLAGARKLQILTLFCYTLAIGLARAVSHFRPQLYLSLRHCYSYQSNRKRNKHLMTLIFSWRFSGLLVFLLVISVSLLVWLLDTFLYQSSWGILTTFLLNFALATQTPAFSLHFLVIGHTWLLQARLPTISELGIETKLGVLFCQPPDLTSLT